MKPSAILVNVARGSLLDQAAAARALAGGRLAGAVLDVFDPEPLGPESPLWDLPNVLVSAHNTVANDVYDENLVRFFCTQLRRYLDGQPVQNVVDKERGY
jgi:phosphoglycerate dehydrogenase-like enzyme